MLALTYVLLGTLLRLGFLAASAGQVSWGLATFGALFVGFAFDLVMAWFLTLPFGLLSACWPSRGWRFPLVAAWGFGAFLFTFWKVSEILFWEEFGVRFNFIAVDYLVYTTEVVKNIKESYNLPLIIAIVLARWRRDLPLLAVSVGGLATAVVLFATWTRPYDSYWFLTLTMSMALAYTLAIAALPWPRVPQALGAVLLAAVVWLQPMRVEQSRLTFKFPEYRAMLVGSRRLAAEAPVLRDIRITFAVHPSMNKYFIYEILGGRLDRAAPRTAFIEPDGRVRIE